MTNKTETLDKLAYIRELYESSRYDLNDFNLMCDIVGEIDLGGFFSEIPNMYIKGINNIYVLNNFSSLIARDGALGLFSFFERFEKPGSLDCILYIHHSLAYIVPKAWKENVKFYGLYFESGKRKRTKLLISGTVYHGINNLSFFQSQLKEVIKNNSISYIEVNINLPVNVGVMTNDRVPGVEEFLNIIESCRTDSIRVKYCSSIDLANDNYESHLFLPIDAANTISSTTVLEQQLYINGAIPANASKTVDGRKMIPLSLRHGIVVLNDNEKNDMLGRGEVIRDKLNYALGSVDISTSEFEIINIIQDMNDVSPFEFTL